MHNDNEYNQENELYDRFHDDLFCRQEKVMSKITFVAFRCLMGKCFELADISIELLHRNSESVVF